MRSFLAPLFIALSLLLFANLAAAQSTCAVPVEYYLTDISGTPLDTSIDVELNFYLSGDADALAVDCRTAREVPVSRGWMRLMLDACSLPPDDGSGCGTSTLQNLFIAGDATGDTVHVGIRIADDPDELTPRVAIGAVPFAVRAGQAAHADDAATVGGINPDQFLRVGDLDCNDGEVLTYTDASGWTCAAVPGTGALPGAGTIMYGNYRIDNIVDLAGLAGYTEITGDLEIRAGDLPTLHGLESLTAVGGELIIDDMDTLTNLEGLNNLVSVGETLWVNHNDALATLEGLNNLTSVGTTLRISHNLSLDNIEALSNITSLPGALTIDHNETLSSLSGLENLTLVTLTIEITNNGGLINLEGLNNLMTIGEHLVISNNYVLTDIGALSGLVVIGWSIYMYGNTVLCQSLVDAFVALGLTSDLSYTYSNDDGC